MAHDLRVLLRWIAGRADQPTAVILDSRTLQSTPESGARAGWDGATRRNGSTTHTAVDTLGHLLDLLITPATTNDRAAVGELTAAVQAITSGSIDVAFVDDGDNGPNARAAAEANGIALVAVTLPEAKRGFGLLPRRWVVERSFAWAARFRRLTRDYNGCRRRCGGCMLLPSAV